jgi:outer membrane protein OmpA-like peptidoglycan-associated protein
MSKFKNMKILLFSLLYSSLLLTNATAGEDPKKIELEKKADKLFDEYHFKQALPYYLEMVQGNEKDMYAHYKLGVCYLYTNDKKKSIDHLLRAKQLDAQKELTDLPYQLGKAYHLTHQFDKAIEQFQLYKTSLKGPEDITGMQVEEADREILFCKNGKSFTANPVKVNLKHLPFPVNTSYSEFSPVLSADGNTLFFSSSRTSGTGGVDKVRGDYNEDIYVATKSGENWTVKNIGTTVNSQLNEAPLSISSDGKTLFYYRFATGAVSHIYYSQKTDTSWSTGKSMGSNINSNNLQLGGTLSADGKRFYFSSDRKGGQGGMDIYYSDLQADGTWGHAVNAGPSINTFDNEEAPQIVNNTLYFASDGDHSMGGFDIFKTTISGNSFSKPVNLGFPINTAQDELYMTFSPDEQKAYCGRSFEKNFGNDDIYILDFNAAPSNIADITAVPVVDNHKTEESHKTENHSPATVAKSEAHKKTETGKNPVAGSSTAHTSEKPAAENKTTPSHTEDASQHAAAGNGEVLKTKVHFPYKVGDAITEFSKGKLASVIEYLNQNPGVKLEVRGYTDNMGNDEANRKISNQRAETVRDYLVSKGIPANRLIVKGMGVSNQVEVKTVNDNVLNRRVEFAVIK